ncbi:hypothetical protein JXJ21_24475 [candidate division KSB1 bacterium]|nr:hypothetical protein [candidate division KSB1 bacterium]
MGKKKIPIIYFIMFALLSFLQANFVRAQERVELKAIFPNADALSIYEIEFSLNDTLKATSEFKVTFPEAFDLSKVKIAGSSTINGGFSVKVAESTVILKRSGRGTDVLPGNTVDVKFANVKNPATPDATHKIKIEILNPNRRTIEKELELKIQAPKEK